MLLQHPRLPSLHCIVVALLDLDDIEQKLSYLNKFLDSAIAIGDQWYARRVVSEPTRLKFRIGIYSGSFNGGTKAGIESP